jgi:hypothetical protein
MSGFGQTFQHRKAEKHFNRFEFATAAHQYEKIIKRNPGDQDTWIRLMHCYRVLNYRGIEKMKARQTQAQQVPMSEKSMNESGKEAVSGL